jgi:hypothetical protein
MKRRHNSSARDQVNPHFSAHGSDFKSGQAGDSLPYDFLK